MNVFLLSWLFLILPASSLIPLRRGGYNNNPQIKTIPSQVATGDIVANFVSSKNGLDGPQLSAVNSTSFDWWYFDVVSPDLKSSLVIVFFTALDSSFPFIAPSTDVDVIAVFYSFPNGTVGDTIWLNAAQAVVTTNQDGSSGRYVGADAAWKGSPDLQQYEININSPEKGVVGCFQLRSLAPAHYPCGPDQAGQNMMVAPNIGWSNAMPDADGDVDFTILGTRLKFNGVAYHDKNWSNKPFQDSVASWYWGHGRLGAYSIVWLDTIAANGTEYVSAYAAKNGRIVASSCQPSSIKVRPAGTSTLYPPSVIGPDPSGYTIQLDLGTDGKLDANVTMVTTIVNAAPAYSRWTGSMVGRVGGRPLLTGGVALLEQFKLVV